MSVTSSKRSPVVLISSIRSGSTMLGLMLGANSELYNPGECDFLFDGVSQSGQLLTAEKFHGKISEDRIFKQKELHLNSNLNTNDSMLDLVEQLYARAGSRSNLMINLHRNFHKVPQLFPDARYLFLVRDPRDVANSCVKLGFAGNHYAGAKFWQNAETSFQRLKLTLDYSQYQVVRYEDLIKDPKRELVKISKFLRVSFQEQMFDYHKSSTYDAVKSDMFERWRATMTDKQVRMVENVAGIASHGYGYQVTNNRNLAQLGAYHKWLWETFARFGFAGAQIGKLGLGLYLCELLSRKLGILPLKTYCQKRIDIIVTKGLK